MRHGGYRPGAGRPRGSKNRKTIALNNALAAVKLTLGPGFTPIEYLLAVMRCPTYPTPIRMYAAQIALPFCHKRLRRDFRVSHRPADAAAAPLPVVVILTPPPSGADED